MPQDQKNFLLALAMSLLVIFMWEVWFAPPAPAPAPPPPSEAEPSNPKPSLAAPVAPQNNPSQQDSRQNVLPVASRIDVRTPSLSGSVSLPGAIFDDLLLINYRDSLDKNAAPVQFLKPQFYQAHFGWSDRFGEIVGAQTNWQRVNPKAPLTPAQPIILTYQDQKTGLVFRREISVDENYMFTITQTVSNQSEQRRDVSFWGALQRKDLPETSGFYLLHEGFIGFFSEAGLEEIDYDDLDEDEPEIKFNNQKGWLGITDKYWASVLIPDQRYNFTARFTRDEANRVETYGADFVSAPIALASGGEASITTRFFAGAKKTDLIDGYMEALSIERFDLMIDWGWFFFMTKPFFLLLDYFSKLTGNFGIAILIVTILVKVAFFPLANKSYETMGAMRKMQPEIEKLRARHKGDMMAQNKEISELWKKHDVKPLMGCLPMLLQIPVFFALYKVLFVTIEMRHAPFFGWIKDLSAADPTSLFNLFGLIPLTLPSFLLIGIWPLLMGATMFVQMRLNPPPPDPVQRKIFAWMPVVITILLAQFPAGLVIYATWNTVLSALQQGIIMKRQGVDIDLLGNLGLKK